MQKLLGSEVLQLRERFLMPSWNKMAEARIQQWLRRPASERATAAADSGPVPPLKLQMLESIVRLYDEASATADVSKSSELHKQAAALETRLLISGSVA